MANPNEYLQQLVAIAQWQKSFAEQQAIERAREYEHARGIKIIRLPLITVTGANPLVIGADSQTAQQGPDQGYVWSMQHLVIEGLTTGATPDRVQILRQGRIIWELNGNQYAQTWGKGAVVLYPGEFLGYQSPAGFTFVATGKIIIHGAAWQVPAEQIWKLL